jgi:putative transposase
MPRPPRISIPGVPLHVVQRGNDRNRTFFANDDYRAYLLLLAKISRRYQTAVHAYVLMTNHVHLLLTSSREDGISRTMQQLGSSYSRRINTRYERTGTLWEKRFDSCPVDTDRYCLACYRYIELNPVRAGIVDRPEAYRWSSHRENIGLRTWRIVRPHASYLALARGREARCDSYATLFNDVLLPSVVKMIRRSTSSGFPLGDETFRNGIAQQTGRTIGSGRRGRPRAAAAMAAATTTATTAMAAATTRSKAAPTRPLPLPKIGEKGL